MPRVLFIPGLTLLAWQAMAATVPDYTRFQIQARTNLIVNDPGYNLPPGASFNSISAHLDDAARVSFPVQVVPVGASGAPGVWFGANGKGALVYTGPVDALISSETHHNAAGVIVYVLVDTGGADGIYRYDPGTQTAMRLSTSPLFPNSYANVRVLDDGAVGYTANFAGGRGLASTLGSSLLHVADQGLDPGSPWTFLYTPMFGADRVHVAKVSTSANFTTATEIRRFDATGASTRLVANRATDPASPIRQFDNGLAINSSGQVAFIGVREADQRRALYRSNGTLLEELVVAQPGGPITGLEFFRPAINDLGWVVFRATDAMGQALYLSDGSVLKRIIGRADRLPSDLGLAQIGQNNVGDPVFSGAPSINAQGDIAFIAALHPDGNNQIEWGTGVYIAYAESALFRDGFED